MVQSFSSNKMSMRICFDTLYVHLNSLDGIEIEAGGCFFDENLSLVKGMIHTLACDHMLFHS